MKAVITGDIINSRELPPERALKALKIVLDDYGNTPNDWEIYRGDSFQLLIKQPENSLDIAMRIKASLKSHKAMDVRMAIGIGKVSFFGGAITESNGEAFIKSGDRFGQLKSDKVNLAIATPWPEFDDEMNLYFKLALITMDHWSKASAEFMDAQLGQGRLSQEELAQLLGIGQSSVSERKKRAHYDELDLLRQRFKTRVKEYL